MRVPFFISCLGLFLALAATSTSAQEKESAAAIEKTARDLTAKEIPGLIDNAAAGDRRSQLLLGRAYVGGFGVKQDYAEAAKWFHKAAERGSPLAQVALGRMYDEGLGVSQDYHEALKWYRKAADQGVANAQTNVGIMYLHGQGTEQNGPEAEKWLRMAGEQGVFEAEELLCRVYTRGGVIPKNGSEAAKWCRKEDHNGRCRLRVKSKDGRTFTIEGDGFEPNEELRVTSRSAGEVMSQETKASSKGKHGATMLPQVLGKEEGTASYTVEGKGCTVSVIYNWRSF